MVQDSINISSQLPLLTFNSLYNILREEKKTKSLQKLPELFYEALDKFLEDKKKELLKLKEQGEKEKIRKENNVLKNSKKITIELLNLRCTKIANISIKNELFGEKTLTDENILEKELQYLEKVKKATKNLKMTIKNG